MLFYTKSLSISSVILWDCKSEYIVCNSFGIDLFLWLTTSVYISPDVKNYSLTTSPSLYLTVIKSYSVVLFSYVGNSWRVTRTEPGSSFIYSIYTVSIAQNVTLSLGYNNVFYLSISAEFINDLSWYEYTGTIGNNLHSYRSECRSANRPI